MLAVADNWIMVPLFVWFLRVTPDVVVPFGPTAFQVHSTLALVFVSLSLAWFTDLLRRGLASRPGPKLQGRLRRLHRAMHLALICLLLFVALIGFLPIAPPLDLQGANEIIGLIHIVEFYALGVVAAGHASFHVWRHDRLRDDALRIMDPKMAAQIPVTLGPDGQSALAAAPVIRVT